MCVLAVLVRHRAGVPLLVAANRDESPSRPAAPPTELEVGVWGGRDLLAGGTWLGINRHGVFVAVTNRRSPAKTPEAISRGRLALEALGCPALGGLEALVRRRIDGRPVAGFNLVAVVDGEGLCLHYDGELRAARFGAGAHVVSSDRDLDDPSMPELRRWREFESAWSGEASPGPLTPFLASHDGDRPVCKHGERFGTVSSTILRLSESGRRLWHAEGPPCRTPFREFPVGP